MEQSSFPPGYQKAFEFPLFSAIKGRRSRRFSLGAEIPGGPLRYASKQKPISLDHLEEHMILSMVAGNTGWHYMIPWSDDNAPDLPRYSNAAGGRTFPSAAGWHVTDFLYTNGPWNESGRVRGGANRYSQAILECVALTAQYIYDRFGKFPGTVPTMFVRTFLQVHHLDLAFYDTFFEPGAILGTHASHHDNWHK